MHFEKEVYVEDFQRRRIPDEPYIFHVSSRLNRNNTVGELVVDDKTLREFGITPSLDLVETVLRLTFKSENFHNNSDKNLLFIYGILRTEMTSRLFSVPLQVSMHTIYQARLSSWFTGVSQCPRYEFTVGLAEREYSELAGLPSNSGLILSLSSR